MEKQMRIAETILKNSIVGGLILLTFKVYHEATVIKRVWYWWPDRDQSHWNTVYI